MESSSIPPAGLKYQFLQCTLPMVLACALGSAAPVVRQEPLPRTDVMGILFVCNVVVFLRGFLLS